MLDAVKMDMVDAAQIASMAYDYTLLAASQAGLGQHLWNIRFIEYPKVAQVIRWHLLSTQALMQHLHVDWLSLAGRSRSSTPPQYGSPKHPSSSN